jgi:hypothetical protein
MVITIEFKTIRAWFAGLFTKKEKTMSLTASSSILIVGATAQITASFAATYVSDTPAVLTVDANGLVTAVSEGSATVTATYASDATKSETITFTVAAADVAPTAPTAPAADASALGLTAAAAASTQPVDTDQDPAPETQTELEFLELLMEKMEATTVKEVKALIGYIRALA